MRHPADRGEHVPRGGFERLAERGSYLAASPLFFSVCFAIVIAWALMLALGASERAITGVAGLMSALTLILVALIKNAELRAELALQRKLDAIATSLLLDKRGEGERGERDLEEAIRIHEEL